MEELYIRLFFFSIDSRKAYMPVLEDFLAEHVLRFSGEKKLTIKKESTGKPYLENIPGCFISIAHSAGIGVCVFSNRNAGIDLEFINASRKYQNIAEEYFSQDELNSLNGTTQEIRLKFYLLWTRKEAWLKKKGLSIWDIRKCGDMSKNVKSIRSWTLLLDHKEFALSLALDSVNAKHWDIHMEGQMVTENLKLWSFPL